MSDSTLVEPTFRAAWGAIVILHMFSAVLNGIIAIQACTYFHKFHRDSYILKSAVSFTWLGCVVLFLCESWALHDIVIIGYDLPAALVTISLGYSIGLVMTVTVSCCVQGVYILRMYRFSHNKYLLVCCCMLMGLELGTGLTWAARVARVTLAWENDVLNQKSKWASSTYFIVCMCLDILIAVSMCYQLWRSRTMGLKQTRRVVDKLMRWTIQTGSVTSAVALSVVLAEQHATSGVWVGIGALVPNCYAIGLLALLNARVSFEKSTTDHLSLSSLPRGSGGNSNPIGPKHGSHGARFGVSMTS